MRRFLQLLAGAAVLLMSSANSEAQIITSVFPNTTSEPLVIGPGLTVPPGQIAILGLNFGEKAPTDAKGPAGNGVYLTTVKLTNGLEWSNTLILVDLPPDLADGSYLIAVVLPAAFSTFDFTLSHGGSGSPGPTG